MRAADTLDLMVRQIRFEAAGINSYELVDPDGHDLPAVTAGSHIDVHLPGGIIRQYSLSNDPAERHRYVIGVLKDQRGRGGSRTLHAHLRVQDRVPVGVPRNNFPLAEDAVHSILLAGGIGVTPLKAMAHRLDALGASWELHYCTRAAANVAFRERMAAWEAQGKVRFHFDGGDPARQLDIAALLAEPRPGTRVYYCGPAPFMAACATAAAHWPGDTARCEYFAAPPATGRLSTASDLDGFSVEIAETGQRIAIGAGQSITEALAEAGVEIPTSCNSGLCGTCKVRYLAGIPDHRDCILGEEERAAYLTPCVSRCLSETLVLCLQEPAGAN
jgi:vanillate O-demethylase ferredoxin subunit